MKTAIQELKESLQSINERYQLKGDANWLMNEVLDLVENSLEKEKEQAIGLIDQTAMFMSVVTQDEDVSKMDFEDVYNSYFNQTK